MARRSTTAAVACAVVVVLNLANPANQTNPANLANPESILVSRQLLESQGLAVGDVVSLSADASGANPRPFRIAGEYEPTPDPLRLGATRYEIRMHLPDLIAVGSTKASASPA